MATTDATTSIPAPPPASTSNPHGPHDPGETHGLALAPETANGSPSGPFTVESLSPHRMAAVDENDELLDRVGEPKTDYGPHQDFAGMILEQLAARRGSTGAQGGPHRLHRGHAVARLVHLRRGALRRGARNRRAEASRHLRGPRIRYGVTPGPRGGGARGGDARFDALVACAFNYEAHASDFP